ncbi:MAG: phospholipase D family protein [Betaproteobacteria bacterium]
MDVAVIERDAIAKRLAQLIAAYDRYFWAVAWATENELLEPLLKHSKKIGKLVIGTHFCQTSPTLLKKVKGAPGVRMMGPDGGTFHPKLYLFADADSGRWAAVVGSPNFTNGAFTANAELAVLLEGEDQKSSPFTELYSAVERYWRSAVPISQEALRRYEIQYRALAAHRKALRRPPTINLPHPGAKHSGLLDYDFADYTKHVKQDRYYSDRMAILREARLIFARAISFAAMSPDERKVIAGTIKAPGFRSVRDWQLFGAMKGQGDFSSLVLKNAPRLSAALDAIPGAGVVDEDNYKAFVVEFIEAFRTAKHKGGVPTASRLLAMNRPDYFPCVDSKNNQNLAADLGYAWSTLSLQTYWTRVIEPLTSSNWWLASRPGGANGLIWDGRAALIDSLYY